MGKVIQVFGRGLMGVSVVVFVALVGLWIVACVRPLDLHVGRSSVHRVPDARKKVVDGYEYRFNYFIRLYADSVQFDRWDLPLMWEDGDLVSLSTDAHWRPAVSEKCPRTGRWLVISYADQNPWAFTHNDLGAWLQRGCFIVSIPIWLALFLSGSAPGIWLMSLMFRRSRYNQRQREGLCVNCGYDLRATPEQCPECGMVRQ